MKLKRDPTEAELQAETDRQMRAWYGGMAVAESVADEDELPEHAGPPGPT